MPGTTRRAAFFDVDETVIKVKSMFDFLRHWHERAGSGADAYETAVARLHAIADAGRPRSEVNRAYYRGFAGVPHADLMAEGRTWYARYRERPDAFVRSTQEALRRHRLAGDHVVFVSGSFSACLDPLAEDLGADLVLGTEPVVGADGRLTGEIVRPMIGEVKALAVRETLDGYGFDAAESCCYGDHASDLDMLRQVGRPHQVGTDPVLSEHAVRENWPRLSAATGPLPAPAGEA